MRNQNKKHFMFAMLIITLSVLAFIVLQVGYKGDALEVNSSRNESLLGLNDNDFISVSINNKEFKLEVARSLSKRSSGLMNKTSMLTNEGMIFIFEEPRILSFYMKNTLIPLDIIFIDKDLKVINIHKNTKVNSETPLYKSLSKSQYVIELNAGTTELINLNKGDSVETIIVQ